MNEMLTVKNLHKSFGAKHVLNDVSFTVQRGHIVALVGPNGAGKSTIMKLILGLIPSDGGELKVDGIDVSITSHQELAKVGALIEYPGIYPFLTGKQHLELFATGADKEKDIDKVVAALQMGSYINAKAKGYSLGMKQKLGIAQALLNNPELVILDEPMNGLDPQAVKGLRDVITNLAAQGTTFLISSHILSELEKLADDVLILNQGKIAEHKTMHDLTHSAVSVFVIHTDNDVEGQHVLAAAGLIAELDHGLRIQQNSENNLDDALRALIADDIHIRAVQQVDHDLESSFLDLINSEARGAKQDDNAN
ncbi:ABC transporter ATP-binding protein [Lacticaseibacillus zhaodongensis]|uniref:ABC transporter ATP-binding protein n=1 Tax=Lacticaseibacillus zhaodongensis TaxID=2668065 RepID=UPI0012D30C6A|nr:ABC transporter ATP-binding protein [Lacticaseibacillus zhaodongensis]